MKCVNCGNEYESKRVDSKYCSGNCRVTAKRNRDVTDNLVTDNVTFSSDSITSSPETITLTESDTLSSMALPNGTTSHYAVDVTLTTADIVAMSNDEAIALLYSWLQGKGTAYQYRVAVLAYKYSNIHGLANTWPIDSAALADSPEDAQD